MVVLADQGMMFGNCTPSLLNMVDGYMDGAIDLIIGDTVKY